MLSINIQEEKGTALDMALLLRHIADQIEKGVKTGYYPHWELKGDEEEVTIHKFGKKYFLYNQAGQSVDNTERGFSTRKAAIEYAMDNEMRLVDLFTQS